MTPFVSRAGIKLEHALETFAVDVSGMTCADLGCNVGGFVDCLLRRGAAKVYAIDTGYGALDWKLRRDARVIVMERTNAMHAQLPEPVGLVTIDVAWTRQRNILPPARALLAPGGLIVTLIKPHYEAERSLLKNGVLAEQEVPNVLEQVKQDVCAAELEMIQTVVSPIRGGKGNVEVLALLRATSGEPLPVG
jgi:23S rRNA (cytidine1920-2'-O)/16S rRNA (cytidine1409-2'-O)-methyltransferase